jgi:hypothetical protein
MRKVLKRADWYCSPQIDARKKSWGVGVECKRGKAEHATLAPLTLHATVFSDTVVRERNNATVVVPLSFLDDSFNSIGRVAKLMS